MSNKSNTHKSKMIDALAFSHGIVTNACKKIGIAPKTYYEWLKKDSEFKKECMATAEQAIDYVESQLFKLIADQNPAAIIFYMKTKAKDRGYVEKHIIDQTIRDHRIQIAVEDKKQSKEIERLIKQN